MATTTRDAVMGAISPGAGLAMRVVIDGLSLNDDRLGFTALEDLLAAWPENGRDELHVVVAEDRALRVPRDVVVHRVRRGGRPFYRRLARAIALPRLCREVRADAVLDARRSVHVVPLPCPRLSLAGPMSSAAEGVSTWSRVARRLHLAIVDQVAVTSWKLRRFKINPSFFVADGAMGVGARAGAGAADGAVVSFDGFRTRRTTPSKGRSARWIAAASISTLALSAAAAASVDLVTSHSPVVNTPQHLNAGTSPINVTNIPTLPTNVPPPSATTPTTPAPSTTSSTAATTTTTTSTTTPSSASAGASSGTVPPLTLPTLTLPITIPSLPLPTVTCTGTTSPASSLSILNLCSVGSSIGPPTLQLGSK